MLKRPKHPGGFQGRVLQVIFGVGVAAHEVCSDQLVVS